VKIRSWLQLEILLFLAALAVVLALLAFAAGGPQCPALVAGCVVDVPGAGVQMCRSVANDLGCGGRP
jgi:hypothetical protein